MFTVRITSLADAQSCTDRTYVDSELWILKLIAHHFYYKVPTALAKMLFQPYKKKGHLIQPAFQSDFGIGFGITLKLIQCYAIELQLQSVDKEQQQLLIDKFASPSFLMELEDYEVDDKLSVALDYAFLASSGMELTLPEKEKFNQANDFGTDSVGQLRFLKWFTDHLRTSYPNAEFIRRVKAYKDKLYFSTDSRLWDLLKNIEMLYYKPEGKFLPASSVSHYVAEKLDHIKSQLRFYLQRYKIVLQNPGLRLTANLPSSKLLRSSDPDKTSATENRSKNFKIHAFLEILGKFEPLISKWQLHKELVEIDGQYYNFASTYYSVLEDLAQAIADEKPSNLDEACTIMGLKPEQLTKEFVELKWQLMSAHAIKIADDSIFVWMEHYSDIEELATIYLAYRIIVTTCNFADIKTQNDKDGDEIFPSLEEFNSMLAMLDIKVSEWEKMNSDFINRKYRLNSIRYHPDKREDKDNSAFLQCILYRDKLIALKAIGFTAAQCRQQKNPKSTPTMALLTSTADIPASHSNFDSHKQEIIDKAHSYLEKRWFSTWLIKQGWGGIVNYFSPLRYKKIILTLEFLASLDEPQAENIGSSNVNMMNLMKPTTEDELSLNVLALKHQVQLEVAASKKEKIMQHIEDEAVQHYQYTQIPIPILWRLHPTDRFYKDHKEYSDKTERIIEVDGEWGKIFQR